MRGLPASLNLHGRAKEVPLSRIELHVHLDGALRHGTIWELSKAKGLPLPGRGDLNDLCKACIVSTPIDLMSFLNSFRHFIPCVTDDPVAFKRIALEFVEDASKNGALYVEARFCPHLLLSGKNPEVKAEDFVKAVNEGFAEGEQLYGTKARQILCCIHGLNDITKEVLLLCEKYRNDGVVGVDIAGDEASMTTKCGQGLEDFHPTVVAAFDEARKLGVHRTVHAGEAGPAQAVKMARDILHAERIGHGYRVLEDDAIYQSCLQDKVHFETCPSSSLLTAAVPLSTLKHPIVHFAEDNANFSINSDDPTVTGTYLNDEYSLLSSWGLNELHFVRANVNAAKASFLPSEEKKELFRNIRKIYNMDMD